MKTLKTNPGAKRLMESLRNMGYDCSTAIADLVDNSVTAQASEIHIDILPKQDLCPAAIVIADNGKGMDRNELREAMRFGAIQEYSAGDLGKYGLGLKTASLSQCRNLTVLSKAKQSQGVRSRRNCMRWDVDYVYETDDWDLLMLTEDELEKWESKILNHDAAKKNGTVILWTKLDEALPLLSSDDSHERERFLAHLIDEVSDHLRMVFHRFMQGAVTGRRKLNIYVCGELLLPWDPFCRSEKTKELDILSLEVVSMDPNGLKMKETISVSPFILPSDDEFSSIEARKDAAGPKGWNQQQGFYFYRNNRLIQAGGWNRLRTPDEHTKLLRVAVDFTGDLDRAFSINVTKMRARIPAEIKDKISSHASGWVKLARARYDKLLSRGTVGQQRSEMLPAREEKPIIPSATVGSVVFSQNENIHKIVIDENKKTGQIKINIPSDSEFSGIFSTKNGKEEELRKLCLATLSILEAVHKKKIDPDNIPIKALRKMYQEYL
jgi:hypothetical protein